MYDQDTRRKTPVWVWKLLSAVRISLDIQLAARLSFGCCRFLSCCPRCFKLLLWVKTKKNPRRIEKETRDEKKRQWIWWQEMQLRIRSSPSIIPESERWLPLESLFLLTIYWDELQSRNVGLLENIGLSFTRPFGQIHQPRRKILPCFFSPLTLKGMAIAN